MCVSVCAVWGGGQILGRPILPLDLSPVPGKPVVAAPLPFSGAGPAPPKPAPKHVAGVLTSSDGAESCRPLGVPVQLDASGAPTMFTADWVIAAPSHLDMLFPGSATNSTKGAARPHTVRGIIILDQAVPFPRKAGAAKPAPREDGEQPANEEDEEDKDAPDSSLFVFPPQKEDQGVLGTVTALQAGSGTFACPEAYSQSPREERRRDHLG